MTGRASRCGQLARGEPLRRARTTSVSRIRSPWLAVTTSATSQWSARTCRRCSSGRRRAPAATRQTSSSGTRTAAASQGTADVQRSRSRRAASCTRPSRLMSRCNDRTRPMTSCCAVGAGGLVGARCGSRRRRRRRCRSLGGGRDGRVGRRFRAPSRRGLPRSLASPALRPGVGAAGRRGRGGCLLGGGRVGRSDLVCRADACRGRRRRGRPAAGTWGGLSVGSLPAGSLSALMARSTAASREWRTTGSETNDRSRCRCSRASHPPPAAAMTTSGALTPAPARVSMRRLGGLRRLEVEHDDLLGPVAVRPTGHGADLHEVVRRRAHGQRDPGPPGHHRDRGGHGYLFSRPS